MIELIKKDKEVDIQLKYYKPEGKKLTVSLYATGDLSHHLIEGIFDIIDKLSIMEGCSHLSKEWKDLADSKIKARMNEIY
jgi:hypothetical protein